MYCLINVIPNHEVIGSPVQVQFLVVYLLNPLGHCSTFVNAVNVYP